jgi:uracil-DNA glycosylase
MSPDDRMDGVAGGAAGLPVLDERHNAMLAEMGVPVWWRRPEGSAPAGALPDAGRAQAAPPTSAPAPTRPATPENVLGRVKGMPPPGVPVAPSPMPPMAPACLPMDTAGPADWPALEAAIRGCRACDLGHRRRQAVPGMGDTSPDWLIVGEAPGEEEDRQGLPFVGRAGQLLDRMLAAMGLSRQEKVYIANVLKCRPPQNRNPDPVEIAHCLPYLWRQIEWLQPRIVLAMGRFAAHALLSHGAAQVPGQEGVHQMPLGKLRGRVHQLEVGGRRIPLVVTYHPAFLLRSPAEKAKAWADLCLALETVGSDRP